MWMINGLHWDDITELPQLGVTEIWRFVNRSGLMHPMHLHLSMFRVLDRQAFTMSGEEIVPVGDPSGPGPAEQGWKDTVQVGPGQIVRVLVRFEDYKGRFAYHCHLLEHEDHGMMRQFETVLCGDGEIDAGEQCDLGAANGQPEACCSALCETIDGCPHVTTTIVETTTTTAPTGGEVCGDATGDGILTSTDALLALRTAVGTATCLACVCDVRGTDGVLASDALAILRAAVGQQVVLACAPCPME
jgi:hypothetical protein